MATPILEKHDSKDKESRYVVERVDSVESFEDALGAPVEKISPLGYHVDWVSVLFLVSYLPLYLLSIDRH